MKQAFINEFTEEILNKGIKAFKLDCLAKKDLGGLRNFVYKIETPDGSKVLRFTHSSHRTKQEVIDELQFIQHLSDGGVRVPAVLSKDKQSLIESVPSLSGEFYVSCFEEVSGRQFLPEDANPSFFFNLGATIGRYHKLSSTYTTKTTRKHWHEHDVTMYANILGMPQIFIDSLKNNISTIKELDSIKSNYGLSHSDLHFSNMFIDEKGVIIFDWDELVNGHYCSDIAVLFLFFLGLANLDQNTINYLFDLLMPAFIKGYSSTYDFNPEWLTQINLFIHYRLQILYLLFYPAKSLNEPFVTNFYQTYEDKINTIEFISKDVINSVAKKSFE